MAYENRHLMRDDEAAMRFAGWYYVKVTLNPAMAEKFGQGVRCTLRVTVDGDAERAPDYVRRGGSSGDRGGPEAAESGRAGAVWSEDSKGSGSGRAGPMRVPRPARALVPVEGSGGSGGASSGAAGDAAGAGSGSASSSTSPGSRAMTVLGVAIGTGTALLLWLGVWRMVAVRRMQVSRWPSARRDGASGPVPLGASGRCFPGPQARCLLVPQGLGQRPDAHGEAEQGARRRTGIVPAL